MTQVTLGLIEGIARAHMHTWASMAKCVTTVTASLPRSALYDQPFKGTAGKDNRQVRKGQKHGGKGAMWGWMNCIP